MNAQTLKLTRTGLHNPITHGKHLIQGALSRQQSFFMPAKNAAHPLSVIASRIWQWLRGVAARKTACRFVLSVMNPLMSLPPSYGGINLRQGETNMTTPTKIHPKLDSNRLRFSSLVNAIALLDELEENLARQTQDAAAIKSRLMTILQSQGEDLS
jgi:hypothetical protein